MNKISQPGRIIIMLIYTLILFSLSFFLFGSPIPPTTEKGIWFYSCLASIILGELITSPYFTSPADAISNATAALITLLAANAYVLNLPGKSKLVWLLALDFNILILLFSVILIITKNSYKPWLSKISHSSFFIVSEFGNHRLVFSAVMLYALVSFHYQDPREYVAISLAWVLIIALQPIEGIWSVTARILETVKGSAARVIGEVAAYEFPNIILVRHTPDARLAFGDLIVAQGDNGQDTLGCVLDQVGFTGEMLHRVLRLSEKH